MPSKKSRLPRRPKAVRIAVALTVLILAAAAVLAALRSFSDTRLPPIAGIGGPFSLIDQRGKSVTERDYLGKPTLVFFGFTNCPDVCPTTLFELTTRLGELGPDADRLNIVFITVDPERDTPQQLALYLASFDPRINGLSGSPENVSAVMKHYRVYARKVPLEGGGYTMDHTATMYMMNSLGKFVGLVNYQEPDTAVRAKLRRLIDSERAG
jgi:protein SCO1/2